MRIFTAAKEVCEGYVFTGVCLSTGGVCPNSCWDTHIPRADTHPGQIPPGRHPLGKHPPGQIPPWADTPLDRHPPAKHPLARPPCTVHAGIRPTSGRYASHWNAFLFFKSSVRIIFSHIKPLSDYLRTSQK